MVPKLEAMIASHEELVNQLLAFEAASGSTLVGELCSGLDGSCDRHFIDQRNDFQSFNRNLRLFSSRYLGTGHRPLQDAINALLIRIEGLRLRLSPGPETPQVSNRPDH